MQWPAKTQIADLIQDLEWVSAISKLPHNALAGNGTTHLARQPARARVREKIARGNYSLEKGVGEDEKPIIGGG